MKNNRPQLSVLLVFHNMRREAPRTLYSLSPEYQRHVEEGQWEVIAVDNGSDEPLDEAMVRSFGVNFRYHFHKTDSVSPAGAINAAARLADGDVLCCCIDGARILSPGIIYYTCKALAMFSNALVYTLGWHLGPELQNFSIPKGYNCEAEDRLLESVDWRGNGYELFTIAALAGASRHGWLSPIDESNCCALPRQTFDALGGFDERFASPGGGLLNLDFFKRACEYADNQLVNLLGEGTFHQVHGGVATNVPMSEHPWGPFHEEYVRLRNEPYIRPSQAHNHYLGHFPAQARRFLAVLPSPDL